MRLALMSDIHSNLQALDACMEHAQAKGAQQFAFLGDMVGYGGNPSEVVNRIMGAVANGAIALRGNHDEMALNPPTETKTLGDSTAGWTSEHLDANQKDWIKGLPLTHLLDKMLLVHASANEPERWRYVTDERSATASLDAAVSQPTVRYVFGGHVHEQSLYYRGSTSGLMKFSPQAGIAVPVPAHRQWLSTVGSVGQPRDGKPEAMYALMDTDRAQLTFFRVAYDNDAAAKAIRRAGLPEFFAKRLETGR